MGFFRCLFDLEETTGRVDSIDYRLSILEASSKAHQDDDEKIPRGLNAIVIFVAISFAMIIGGVIDDISLHGAESIYDFMAYVMPSAAAISGGMGLFWKRRERFYFWVSAILLVIGYVFYLASKNISNEFWALFLIGLSVTFVMSLIYDEYIHRQIRRQKVDIFSRFFLPLVLILVLIPVLFLFIWANLRRQGESTCEIRVQNPVTINIKKMVKNGTENHLGGASLSERLILNPLSVIEIKPCKYEIQSK